MGSVDKPRRCPRLYSLDFNRIHKDDMASFRLEIVIIEKEKGEGKKGDTPPCY